MSNLSYPIGKFEFVSDATPDQRKHWIDNIAATPANLRQAVASMDDAKLETPYRPGGWTVRQVIHHVADSHINSYVRIRLALTEDSPSISAYDEKSWAELHDARTLPIEVSLGLLDGIHARWASLLRHLDDAAFLRAFIHPELGPVTVDRSVQLYSWHGRHHLAHITSLTERGGW
jgi:uncharacterized damage-inducible protein DinB